LPQAQDKGKDVPRETKPTPSERLLQLIRPAAAARGADPSPDAAGKPANRPRGRTGRSFGFGGPVHIGVDISPFQLVCVKTRGQDSSYEVLGTLIEPLPEGAEPGTPEFVVHLRQALGRLCVPGERPEIWAASQSAKVNIQYVTIPKVASRQVDNAVFWTAKKDMGFDEGVVLFDFERRGEVFEKGASRLGALAYTASRESAQRLKEDFAQAGYPLRGLTMESFTNQNLFRRRLLPRQEGATAVLHVGRNWSRLEIGSRGGLLFVRVIKTSMAGMEQAILDAMETKRSNRVPSAPADASAEAPAGPTLGPEESVVDLDGPGLDGSGFVLELDSPAETPQPAEPQPEPEPSAGRTVRPEDARELLCTLFNGCEAVDEANPGKGFSEAEILGMLEPAASRLVRQVEMTIKHFRESLGFEDVTRILVSGPMGASRRFLDYIGEQLGLPCHPLDPLGDYLAKGGNVPGIAAPGVFYTQALGLALSDMAVTPNILFTYRAKAEARAARFLEQTTLVGLALILLLLAFFTFRARMTERALARERDTIVRQLDGIGGRPDLAALTAKVDALRARRQAAGVFLDRTRIPALWGAVLDLAPEGVAVGTLSAEFPPPPVVAKAPAKKPAGKGKPEIPGRLVLVGVITGDPLLFDSRLASYVVALEQAPFVHSVSVKNGGQEILDGGVTGMRFTLSLVLAEKTR